MADKMTIAREARMTEKQYRRQAEEDARLRWRINNCRRRREDQDRRDVAETCSCGVCPPELPRIRSAEERRRRYDSHDNPPRGQRIRGEGRRGY